MFGVWKTSAIAVGAVAKSMLNGAPNLFAQQTRNTVILRRKYPLPLHKKGKAPHKFRARNMIYEVIENTGCKAPKPLDIILLEYVAGYGEKGDKLSLKPLKAYNDFLLPGLAVYASPENIEKYLVTGKKEKTYSSKRVPFTTRILEKACIVVRMNIENPWVIEKWHIKSCLRQAGFNATNESITLPEKQITGPNLDNEGKEFYVTITINKTEKVKVRCKLHHDTCEITKQLETDPDFYKTPGEAIFPEDQEILDSMPRPSSDDTVQK